MDKKDFKSMIKIVIFSFFFIFAENTCGQSNYLDVDSIAITLNNSEWQEADFRTEWSRPIDSSSMELVTIMLKEIGNVRILNMLKFFDANKIEDGLWDIFCELFMIKDKTKGIISIPTYAPLFGKISLKGTRIIINYYQSDLVDEILFCDKNTLVIRHSSSEKIEVVTYKRYE